MRSLWSLAIRWEARRRLAPRLAVATRSSSAKRRLNSNQLTPQEKRSRRASLLNNPPRAPRRLKLRTIDETDEAAQYLTSGFYKSVQQKSHESGDEECLEELLQKSQSRVFRVLATTENYKRPARAAIFASCLFFWVSPTFYLPNRNHKSSHSAQGPVCSVGMKFLPQETGWISVAVYLLLCRRGCFRYCYSLLGERNSLNVGGTNHWM